MAKDLKNKDTKNKDAKNKKETKHFFKDFKAELKKVIWPTPKQIVNNTVAVIVIVLIFALTVFVLDVVFDLFNELGINKLKQSIKNKVVVENTVEADLNEVNSENVVIEESTQENNNIENAQ